MAQNFTDDVYAADHVGATDLQNIETNFEVLKGSFSGGSSPGNPVAGLLWFDTNEETLKVRDAANSEWYGIMQGSNQQTIWIYANSADEGWVLWSSLTDRVLAIKGGSTYVTGGTIAGTWTAPTHTLALSEIPSHDHDLPSSKWQNGSGEGGHYQVDTDNATRDVTTDAVGGGGSHSHGGTTYRPAAAVGALFYPHK